MKNEKRSAQLLCALVFLSFSFFIFRFSLAQATQPATTQPAASIQKWLDELADTEPAVREEARSSLLKLSRDDLPALKESVKNSLPLAAAQAGALREIVTHVYLKGEAFESIAETGFLGVRLSELSQVDPPPVRFDDPSGERAGVLIWQCMPGFAAYAALREGDVVLSVQDGQIGIPTPRVAALTAIVKTIHPGKSAKLTVLRHGREVELTIPIGPRPQAADNLVATEEMLNDRANRAQEYWREHFAPLLAGPVS